jgi:hypothetical protein
MPTRFRIIAGAHEPVLTEYRKRIRDNIQICQPSCDEPHGEATDSRSTWNFGRGPWQISI